MLMSIIKVCLGTPMHVDMLDKLLYVPSSELISRLILQLMYFLKSLSLRSFLSMNFMICS